METVSAVRLFSEAFDWFASLSTKLPKIEFKTFFIVVIALLIGIGVVVGLTYFGSYRFKLLRACRKIIKYLAGVDSIDDDNVKDFTDQCFSAKAPTSLCDSWKLYLGVRFGYPSDIVSESAVYDSVVKRVREVRASVYIGIALILVAAFAFWGYGTLDGNDMGVIFCAGLLLSGAMYILLVMLNRLLSKRCLEVFDEMQIELDAKVDLQVDKSYATDSSPLTELAAMLDEIIARNTAKNVGFDINSDEETPIEKLIANAQQSGDPINIADFEHDFYDIEEYEKGAENAEHSDKVEPEAQNDEDGEDVSEDDLSEDLGEMEAQDDDSSQTPENTSSDKEDYKEEDNQVDDREAESDFVENSAKENAEEDTDSQNVITSDVQLDDSDIDDSDMDENDLGDFDLDDSDNDEEANENSVEDENDLDNSNSDDFDEEMALNASDEDENSDGISESDFDGEFYDVSIDAQDEDSLYGKSLKEETQTEENKEIVSSVDELLETEEELDGFGMDVEADDMEEDTDGIEEAVDDIDESDEDSEAEDSDASIKAMQDDIVMKVREVIEYAEDDEYVSPARLVRLPNLVDYVISNNPSSNMLINVSRLLLVARNKFEHSIEDRRIVDNCIGKLIVALHNHMSTNSK